VARAGNAADCRTAVGVGWNPRAQERRTGTSVTALPLALALRPVALDERRPASSDAPEEVAPTMSSQDRSMSPPDATRRGRVPCSYARYGVKTACRPMRNPVGAAPM
jgi:hypothetical protein